MSSTLNPLYIRVSQVGATDHHDHCNLLNKKDLACLLNSRGVVFVARIASTRLRKISRYVDEPSDPLRLPALVRIRALLEQSPTIVTMLMLMLHSVALRQKHAGN